MFIESIIGDLFDSNDSLAHCVSSDLKMSRGIAVQFREKFHEYSQLPTRALVGEVLVFQSGNRYIFSLITKRNFFHKPTYETLQLCLENLCEKLVLLGVNTLSVPKLGCGLDGLSWNFVLKLMQTTFNNCFNLRIRVYCLAQLSNRYASYNINYICFVFIQS